MATQIDSEVKQDTRTPEQRVHQEIYGLDKEAHVKAEKDNGGPICCCGSKKCKIGPFLIGG